MADAVERINLHKCCCCRQYIKKLKHAVNLFGDKSLNEGIKEGLELYGGCRVEEDVNIGVLSYVCQQCYTLIHSIVERIKKLCGICSQSSVAWKRSVCQRSPSQLTLSPSYEPLPEKRQREQSSDLRHCLFPPVVSSDILPRPIQMDTINQSMNRPGRFLDRNKVARLVTIVNFGIPEDIGNEVMSMPLLKASIQQIILKELDEQCRNLCKIKKNGGGTGPSVLLVPSSNTQECLENFTWDNIIQEMKENIPFLYDILTTVATPVKKDNCDRGTNVCMAYGIMMNGRWKKLSLLQKVVTMIIGFGHSSSKTFERLNTLGLCQSRTTYRNMLDTMDQSAIHHIRKLVNDGCELRMIFDNFDFKILTNIILKGHKNADMHWITQYITFDRVQSTGLCNSKPIVSDINEFENKNYLLSQEELEKLRHEYIILVARVLVIYFPCLKAIKNVVEKDIAHKYSKEMATPSTIINMAVVPYNQNKTGDVCQYLDTLTQTMVKVYEHDGIPQLPIKSSSEDKVKRASKVLQFHEFPLVGDLLGRERVTGAKKTRAGCDLRTDRFDHIVEVPAVWHAKQSFLSYTWEQLYNTKSAREIGTLYNLRQKLRKNSVYADVKKNYKAAAQFMSEVTAAYLCESFMEWTGMKNLKENPPNITIPSPQCTNRIKENFLTTVIGNFVDEFVLPELDMEERNWKKEQKKASCDQDSQATAPNVVSQASTSSANQISLAVEQTSSIVDQVPSSSNNTEQCTPRNEDSAQTGLHSFVAHLNPNHKFNTGDGVIIMSTCKKPLAIGIAKSDEGSQLSIGGNVLVHVVYKITPTSELVHGKSVIWPKTLTAKPFQYGPPNNTEVSSHQSDKSKSVPTINARKNSASSRTPKTSQLNTLQPSESTLHRTRANVTQQLFSPLVPPVPVAKKDTTSKKCPKNGQDCIFNYGMQVIQLGVFLLQLDDTEREGDGERMMRNWKLLMLYSRSRNRAKKYAFEAMRLITNCYALFSEKMAHRVIHGQFVNPKGGQGNNYANDLKQEHIVKANKAVLRGLCGNKTLKAVTRSTKSAYCQKVIIDNLDKANNIHKNSSSHTYGNCEEDVKDMIETLRQVKPFQFTVDRHYKSFQTIGKSPLDKLDAVLLHKWLTRHKLLLASNPYANDVEATEESNDTNINEAEDEVSCTSNDENVSE